eukprot:Plantae.Rhodophyta-Palmaria_palmata.ctg6115.p1 GENE.Plantae.Rhodophyta-Palmaria_palmata.ctg6115~~Plantae.Rhodophyta-Palmaria_palmata.ctg6115.p1  ORF type:complete len:181 (-),score=23.44 Plantae.Rhodophyta-Palmaria_palmata.ctg6115:48-560(-)
MKEFDCDEQGEVKEYVGCRVEYDKEKQFMRLTQPVLVQSFEDEFELPKGGSVNTPSIPGSTLVKHIEGEQLGNQIQSHYRSGVGKLLHIMRWSRPDVLNSVRELSRYMTEASDTHLQAMYRTMRYIVESKTTGRVIHPDRGWNGDPNFEFVISGESDSDYAKDVETYQIL